MERRRFLGIFVAGVAGIAIEQAIPFGRVWSFPKEIVIGFDPAFGSASAIVVEEFEQVLDVFDPAAADNLKVGDIFKIRTSPRYRVSRSIGGRVYEVQEYPGRMPFTITHSYESYSGAPPALPPVAQLKSLFPPAPERGIPES
jgi:hypothetical protein